MVDPPLFARTRWGQLGPLFGQYRITDAMTPPYVASMSATKQPLVVLFDLDGTLIDSIELILNSTRHAFRDWPRRRPTDEDWLASVGIPLAAAMRQYAETDDEVSMLIASYREYQMAHHDRLVRCYDGVPETLELLRRDGHPLGVVTSKSDALAQRGLEHVGIAHLFDTIVGCDSCTRHKPRPEPVLVALERIGGAPERAVFVGDSVHDIEAGNAAGVHSVAALWGPFTKSQLEGSSPSHYLASIKALPALLGELSESTV